MTGITSERAEPRRGKYKEPKSPREKSALLTPSPHLPLPGISPLPPPAFHHPFQHLISSPLPKWYWRPQ